MLIRSAEIINLKTGDLKKIENFKKDHNFEKACKAVSSFFQQTN